MFQRFGNYPGAMENTLEIAERCNVELDFSRSQMPEPEIPEGMNAGDYLEKLAWEGMKERYPNPTDEIKDRVRMELDVIKTMGYPKYFLIVRDFAQFARKQGICIGVRGSAAGAIVGYCTGITDVDPIDYGLPFERFLNIERVSMPDIDMDFQDDRRDEVIRYVTEKYGADHVSQIITFGTLGAKAAVRDCGRALGIPLADVDKIGKMIPSIPVGISIDRAMQDNHEFATLYERDPQVKKLIDTAKQLEGVSRHSSTHAAGIIISGDPLVESCPVMKGSKGEIISQFDAHGLEMVGLLKMDFLGLANLTILARCIESIKQSCGKVIDIHKIPWDDAKTYEMLGNGDTTGVFQLESAGMRKYIQELKPTSVKELAAMIALYRPGPMASIPQYIRCKNGLEKIKYIHPCLEPILKDSYGVVVYQDDVMYIARAVAGFTLGQADILRRAMGKKKKEEMDKMKAKFYEGAEKNDISRKKAEDIFDLVEPFAGYGFNKAHAVCYAHVAYQTAYLKANYPVEYFTAMLATHFDNKDKVSLYIEEARRLKIEVLQPDVNSSESDFCVEDGAIRFGLAAIKNCGKGVVDAIIGTRRSGGPFKSLQDFCERVLENGQVGKSTIDTLIKAGAFSSIIPNRKAAAELLEGAMSRATAVHRDKLNGQAALFGGLQEDHSHEATVPEKYEGIEDYSREELLAMERDLLGLYVSDHPLQHFREALESRVSVTSDKLPELSDGQECIIGGLITDVRYHHTKKSGDKMAFIKIEDLTGQISVTVFPSVFKTCSDQLVVDRIVIINGKASHRERMGRSNGSDDGGSYQVEVVAEDVSELKNGNGARPSARIVELPTVEIGEPRSVVDDSRASAIHIRINYDLRPFLPDLRAIVNEHPGELQVYIHVPNNGSGELSKVCTGCCVAPSPQFFAAVTNIVGPQAVWTE
jgi:DNA polymerase-3 subunit alpha